VCILLDQDRALYLINPSVRRCHIYLVSSSTRRYIQAGKNIVRSPVLTTLQRRIENWVETFESFN
jgi:hypothetical protein